MGFKKGKILGLATLMALALPLSPPQALAEGQLNDIHGNLYEAVEFDHDMHIELLQEDCSKCHHHVAGVATSQRGCASCHRQAVEVPDPSCKSCHSLEPFSAAELGRTEGIPFINHRVKPGLKAAYHQGCLGCHQEMGGPVGCQDCHAMTENGEKFYHTGAHAPAPGKTDKHH
ncbi:MAG: cytochrome c3 family protein [Thermodesulfobacteriota bacterium]